MQKRYLLFAGLLAPLIFWLSYFIGASLYPGYSCLTKAVSELGAVSAPGQWEWNIFGYIIPGLMIAFFSWGLQFAGFKPRRKLVIQLSLALSGLFMAFSGIFPGDFENKKSLTMLLHTLGSFGSYLFYLIAAFVLNNELRAFPADRKFRIVLLVLVYLSICFGSWPFVFSKIPALGQRFVFLFYFIWIFLLAAWLLRPRTKLQ